MVLPLIAAAGVGALLGGGSQTTQTTTVNSSNANAFNPVINFGGDASFVPSAPVNNDFAASTVSSQTQEQADPADLAGLFVDPATAALGNIAGAITPSAPSSALDLGLDPNLFGGVSDAQQASTLPLVILGVVGIGAFFLFTNSDKKGG